MRVACLVLAAGCAIAQSTDYAPENENAVHKTVPGKQLYKEDEPCGAYFWKSMKASPRGVSVYFFYGSTEYGKGKLGLYLQAQYRVQVDESKDPPTAQAVKTKASDLSEIVVRMTGKEFQASGACFPK
jgi:hypothetical protein